MKLKNKKYHSMKEYNYRFKIFKDNLLYFIKKEDNPRDRIFITNDLNGRKRLYIIPDKKLNIDFYEPEENVESSDEDALKFEINKFSDMSKKEFESIFTLDQKYFDEKINPPYFNPDHNDSKLGIQNIEKYLNLTKTKGFKKKEKKSFFNPPQEKKIPEHYENFTPHFSSDPNHKSIWKLGQPHNAYHSPGEGIHNDFLKWGRRLENYIKLPPTNEYISMDGVKLPLVLNWRDLNAINDIKDQFLCNACYAFAGIGALEGRYKIKTGEMIELSEQEIVDCSRENNGCVGGLPHKVFQYIQKNDISFMKDYRFDQSRDKICRKKSLPRFDGSKVKSYTNLPVGLINLLKNLTTGPISVISYSSYPFRNYAGGIFRGEGCWRKYKANHASVLIGYNLKGPVRYLYFKNGWGTDWGELGYYKVKVESLSPSDKSHCLIAAHNFNSIPILG
jgi:hypothetical protein